MRRLCALTLVAALLLVAPASRADKPDPARAFLAGASVFLAGFAIGGSLLASSQTNPGQSNVGWLTIEAAFATAPFVSHALTGEWLRAAAFSATPATTVASTAMIFAINPVSIDHGELAQQRVLWALFGIGLFSGAVGVVDSTFAGKRAGAVAVAPMLGAGQVGVKVGGTLW